jgi:hypothetical protein
MSQFLSLFSTGTIVGALILAALLVIVGAVLWWNRKVD